MGSNLDKKVQSHSKLVSTLIRYGYSPFPLGGARSRPVSYYGEFKSGTGMRVTNEDNSPLDNTDLEILISTVEDFLPTPDLIDYKAMPRSVTFAWKKDV